jgi:membrane fusion protein, multidrug efflux system
VIILIIAALVVSGIVSRKKKPQESVKEEIPTEVTVEEVKNGDITKTLSYIGNIVGSEQTNIYPIEETGKLIKYLVKEGDIVSKGDTVALIDRSVKGMDYKPAIINSPIPGIVGNLSLDPGSMVAPGMPIAMVANINTVKVEMDIPENDISLVKRGMKANIKISSYPDDIFNGQLKEMNPVLNPMSRTASASISIPNPGRKLRPGMFANVELIIEEHNGVVVVSEKAITEKDNKKVVFVIVDGDKAERREVTTGLESNGFIEILTGLNPGEKIITLGNYGLENGTKITVKN